MKLTMACSSWIKKYDEPVLEILQKADKMPTVDELTTLTGLPRWRVEQTLRSVRKQVRMAASRRTDDPD